MRNLDIRYAGVYVSQLQKKAADAWLRRRRFALSDLFLH